MLEHPRFRHLRKRGKDVRRHEFLGVRWLVADMNIAPEATLDEVEAIVTHPGVSIRGMILTLKLSEWSVAERLPELTARVRSWGFRDVRMRQLVTGGQEVCLAALRRKELRRLGALGGMRVSRQRQHSRAAAEGSGTQRTFRAAFLIFGARWCSRYNRTLRGVLAMRAIPILATCAMAAVMGCRGLPQPSAAPRAHELEMGQLRFVSDFELPADHRLVRELVAERHEVCADTRPRTDERTHCGIPVQRGRAVSPVSFPLLPQRAVATGVFHRNRYIAHGIRPLERPRG